MLVGYARVSTADHTLALQRDALSSAGGANTFTDTVSGLRADRRGLDEALEFLLPRSLLNGAVREVKQEGSCQSLARQATSWGGRGQGFGDSVAGCPAPGPELAPAP